MSGLGRDQRARQPQEPDAGVAAGKALRRLGELREAVLLRADGEQLPEGDQAGLWTAVLRRDGGRLHRQLLRLVEVARKRAMRAVRPQRRIGWPMAAASSSINARAALSWAASPACMP